MNSYNNAVLQVRKDARKPRRPRLSGRAETLRTEFSNFDRVTAEAVVLGASFVLAFLLRYGGHLTLVSERQLLILGLPFVAGRLVMEMLFGVQKIAWRYISMGDTFRLSVAHAAFTAFAIVLSLSVPASWPLLKLPLSLLVIELFLSIQGAIALRIARRYVYERRRNGSFVSIEQKPRRLLLIGAGTLGSTVAKEMGSRSGIELVGFLDDDRRKIGSVIASRPVLGPTAILPDLVRREAIDDVLVCIRPTARDSFNRTWALLEHLPIRKRFVPSIEEILDSADSVPQQTQIEVVANKSHQLLSSESAPVAASRLQGKTVLITGGAGFIGSSIAQRLVAENRVILLDRVFSQQPISFSSLLDNPNVKAVQADILDGSVLEEWGAQADIVVHAAAIVGVGRVCNYPRETLETNFVGTSRLFHALEQSNRLERVIYFSTSEVFGVNSFRVHEDAPTSVGPAAEARWSYAIAKLAGEHLVKSYHRQAGMPVVTVRPFNVFGPRRVGAHAIRSFVMNALQGRPLELHGDGSQIRSWCYIEDFVDALIEMMVRPQAVGEDFNIGNSQNTLTIHQLAQKVIEFTGSKSPLVFRETHIPDIDVRVPSLEKAHRLLDYQCKFEMDRALGLTIEWYRAHFSELCEQSTQIPLSDGQMGHAQLPALGLRAAASARA